MKTKPFVYGIAGPTLVLLPLVLLFWTQWNPSYAQDSLPRNQRQIRSRQEVMPPSHFKSGGERSEIILKEIATTLKSIDARLEKIEKVVERNVTNPPLHSGKTVK